MNKPKKSPKKLICFDLDGTIIDAISSFWKHGCEVHGCDMKRRQEGVDSYMKNLITYDQWVEHDLSAWAEKGIRRGDLVRTISRMKLLPNSIETLKKLKKMGLKVALISDSLDIALEVLIPDYKEIFDDVMINRIIFDKEGKISGWEATKYGMERKAEGLKMIAKREKLELDECVFVGDGDNDVRAAEIAGLSIALNSRSDELRETADIIIDKKDLKEILKYI